MSTIYNALKKAEREGTLDNCWLPRAPQPPGPESKPIHLPGAIIQEFLELRQHLHQAHSEQGVRVLTITSSVPGEGCSTMTYFLSLLIAKSYNGYSCSGTDRKSLSGNGNQPRKTKNNVLVIDGNLQKPVLHQLFNVEQNMGIAEFMVNGSSNIFTRAVDADNMTLVTAGMSNDHWHDTWHSDRIKLLFDKLRGQYDYIFIDAPPVIGHPETLALARLTDGVLLVVKANETRLEVIDQANEQLRHAGVKVLGVVLNERKFFVPAAIYQRF